MTQTDQDREELKQEVRRREAAGESGNQDFMSGADAIPVRKEAEE